MAIIRYNKDGTQMTSQQIIEENNRADYRNGHWGTVFVAVWSLLLGILGGVPIWGIVLMVIGGVALSEEALWYRYKRD